MTVAEYKRRRCSNPECTNGYKGRGARVSGRFKMCRTCRSDAAVKKNAQRARARSQSRSPSVDGSVPGSVSEGHSSAA